jgi:hypothetical protein
VTTEPSRRRDGLRYELQADDSTWWELGWDPGLGTFFAQRWHAARDIEITDWHGATPGELSTIGAVEHAIGRTIPEGIRAELEADRTSAALRQGAPA